jgi:hypothetical protein
VLKADNISQAQYVTNAQGQNRFGAAQEDLCLAGNDQQQHTADKQHEDRMLAAVDS